MPIFEYACKQCENRFEVLLRRNDQDVACPKCQSANLNKLFSGFASHTNGKQTSESWGNLCPPSGCGSCPDPGFCAN
jgi:putative FmdB family regulatory protein